MQVMKDDQVEDKRVISKVSLAFINERLDGLTKSIDTLSQKYNRLPNGQWHF